MNEIFDFIANASLFGVFLTLSIVGILIFFVAFVFDGIFDFHLGIAGADVPAVQFFGVFLGTGGGTGLIAIGLGIKEPLFIILASVLVGVVLALIFAVFMKRLQHSSNREYPVNTEAVVGSAVSVSWWSGTEGEVLISLGGNTFKVAAESEEELFSPGKLLVKEAKFSGDRPIKVIVEKL